MEIKKIKLNMAPLKHIVEKEGDIRSAMVQTMSIYVATLFCCESCAFSIIGKHNICVWGKFHSSHR